MDFYCKSVIKDLIPMFPSYAAARKEYDWAYAWICYMCKFFPQPPVGYVVVTTHTHYSEYAYSKWIQPRHKSFFEERRMRDKKELQCVIIKFLYFNLP
jgi:hypothetical protein